MYTLVTNNFVSGSDGYDMLGNATFLVERRGIPVRPRYQHIEEQGTISLTTEGRIIQQEEES